MPHAFARRILLVFAHPALEKSRVNRRLVEAVADLEGVTFHDLYEAYPDFAVQVEEEQALLEDHDLIVLQHPFYWYSTPALVKEWLDLVLTHGWAYGSGGDALDGKQMLSVVTTGGQEESYCTVGSNRFTMRQLLAPLEQTARLCGVEYLPPFIVHGTHRMERDEIAVHAELYRRTLEALRDDAIDLERGRELHRLNLEPDLILDRPADRTDRTDRTDQRMEEVSRG